jgi:DNA-binding IclR family transcriptional regulator
MEKYAGTQAIARTFHLIDLFDDEHPVWSLPDLVEASGLTRSTAYRLMAALEAEGIMRRTEGGDYTLGPTLIVYGGRAIRANPLRPIAQPFLRELVSTVGESSTIDMLWIDEEGRPLSVVVEEHLGQRMLGMAQYIGARIPAHTTSTGKVLLAFSSAAAFSSLNFAELPAATPNSITTIEQLNEELAQVRAQGFATTDSELEIGLSAVSAPIFNHHGEVIAALCIAGPVSRLTSEKLLSISDLVKDTANRISKELGSLRQLQSGNGHYDGNPI